MIAQRDYEVGQEVFSTYGTDCNARCRARAWQSFARSSCLRPSLNHARAISCPYSHCPSSQHLRGRWCDEHGVAAGSWRATALRRTPRAGTSPATKISPTSEPRSVRSLSLTCLALVSIPHHASFLSTPRLPL
eukprot:3879667-Rhodomonas_salina.4